LLSLHVKLSMPIESLDNKDGNDTARQEFVQKS